MENANRRRNVRRCQLSYVCRIFGWSVCFVSLALRFYYSPIHHKIRELSKHGDDLKIAVEEEDVYHHSHEVFKMKYAEMEEKFKIYVYPSNDDDEDDDQGSGHDVFECRHSGCAWYFFKNLVQSFFVTDDPDEAHLFLVPLSNNKMLEQVPFEKELGFLVAKYMSHIISKYPYWNRTSGSDHLFLSCDEIVIQATQNILLLIKNSTRLVYSPSYKSDYNDVSIPSVMHPFKGHMDMYIINRGTKRRGYWVGGILRKVTIDASWTYSNNGADLLNNGSYFDDIQRDDKFCDCLGSGSVPMSDCIVTAIYYDCVPVILADYDPPFSDILDWQKFSVIVRTYEVHLLRLILSSKSGEYGTLYRNLLKVRHHFQWNSPSTSYDAFHMVLYDLWLRRKQLD